jgi:hypothetical protein
MIIVLSTLVFKNLHEKYFAEFNNADMIHAIYISLKHVYKKKMFINDVNINEKVMIEEAYYYM